MNNAMHAKTPYCLTITYPLKSQRRAVLGPIVGFNISKIFIKPPRLCAGPFNSLVVTAKRIKPTYVMAGLDTAIQCSKCS